MSKNEHININFVKIKDKDKELTKLRDRFAKKKYTVVQYAKILGVSHSIVSNVLDGVYNGKHKKQGSTRRVFAELKSDGVWVGPLPWET